MTDPVVQFYDGLSPEYRDGMGWDWEAAVRGEGETLDRFLAQQMSIRGPCDLLDCTCGIGTQAIGLALQGHRVHATDLSALSVQRARQEASRLGVTLTFGVADFRKLEEVVSKLFDVVLTCDNAIAHCLEDEDLDSALASMKGRLRPGGLLLMSLRDYDALLVDKPRFNNEHVHDRSDGRRIAFQLWDWAGDARRYRMHQFLIAETRGRYDLKHFETALRALRRDDVIAAVWRAGYRDVHWHEPGESEYYQPIVTARNG